MQHHVLRRIGIVPIYRRFREDQTRPSGMARIRHRTMSMIFSNLVRHARSRIDKRMRYGRLVAEIQSLTHRDLADMGADRGEMLRHAYLDIYGK
jgi:hypothetical protein